MTEDVVMEVRTDARRPTMAEVHPNRIVRDVSQMKDGVPSDIEVVPCNAAAPMPNAEAAVNVNRVASGPAQEEIIIGEISRRLRAVTCDGVILDKIEDVSLYEREGLLIWHHPVGIEVVEEISYHARLRFSRVGDRGIRAIPQVGKLWVAVCTRTARGWGRARTRIGVIALCTRGAWVRARARITVGPRTGNFHTARVAAPSPIGQVEVIDEDPGFPQDDIRPDPNRSRLHAFRKRKWATQPVVPWSAKAKAGQPHAVLSHHESGLRSVGAPEQLRPLIGVLAVPTNGHASGNRLRFRSR